MKKGSIEIKIFYESKSLDLNLLLQLILLQEKHIETNEWY